MKSYATNRIAWIDLETTGLDHIDGYILEAAIVVTDGVLNPIFAWDTVYGYSEPDLAGAKARGTFNDWAVATHTASGLLGEVRNAWENEKRLLRDDGREFVEILRAHDAIGAPLGGSSPHFDRRWIGYHMPELHDALGYRHIDVSSLLTLLDSWGESLPGLDRETPTPHRAMPDIKRSIDTARAFRRLIR